MKHFEVALGLLSVVALVLASCVVGLAATGSASIIIEDDRAPHTALPGAAVNWSSSSVDPAPAASTVLRQRTVQDLLDAQVNFKAGLPALPQNVAAAPAQIPKSVSSPSPTNSRRGRQPTRPPAKKRTNCSVKRCIALTFDDGPSSANTPRLLRILKKADVPVTFFVVGQEAARYPAIIAREVKNGHEVGDHSWNHPQLTRMSKKQIERQLRRTSAAIQRAGAPAPTLVRPPYGATNKKVASVARAQGMAQVLWSVDTLDWKHHSPKKTRKNVAKYARRGSIILMHDSHSTAVDAVARVIKDLKARGFTLVTVSDLLGDPQPGKVYFNR